MSNTFDLLNDDNVRKIALLVEALDRSSFDYLQLEMNELKLTLGKGNMPVAETAASVPAQSEGTPDHGAAAVTASPTPVQSQTRSDDGTVAIVAPIIGRFYAKPDPSAAPFVSVGAQVTADTTVALIEVMKVFNAVPAGVSGIITEICVQDAEFVEFGQMLFRIRPTAA